MAGTARGSASGSYVRREVDRRDRAWQRRSGSALNLVFDGLAREPLVSTECRDLRRAAAGAGPWHLCWPPSPSGLWSWNRSPRAGCCSGLAVRTASIPATSPRLYAADRGLPRRLSGVTLGELTPGSVAGHCWSPSQLVGSGGGGRAFSLGSHPGLDLFVYELRPIHFGTRRSQDRLRMPYRDRTARPARQQSAAQPGRVQDQVLS
jgi:hypothetical protein